MIVDLKTKFFCLNCGKQTISLTGDGDQYFGEEYICSSCKHIFWISIKPEKRDLDDS